MSLEPDLNQRPKDICMSNIYSPPLYQLSYRGLSAEHAVKRVFICCDALKFKILENQCVRTHAPMCEWLIVTIKWLQLYNALYDSVKSKAGNIYS